MTVVFFSTPLQRCKPLLPALAALLFFMLISKSSTAQTSLSEKTGFWDDGSMWTGGAMPGTASGGTVTTIASAITINGTIYAQAALSLTTLSNLTINTGDTLVVHGNLTLTGSGLVNNGVLIVLGNYHAGASSTTNNSSGKMVVTGNYTSTLSSNTLTGPAYVYGSRPSGSENETDLINDDNQLYQYVQDIQSILPVTLLSYSAVQSDVAAVLSWSTGSEQNNDHYVIERSGDALTFERIATVPGSGTTPLPSHYSWTDLDPLPGSSYYRLSQVDIDGTRTILELVSYLHRSELVIRAYPNPCVDHLSVKLPNAGYTVYVENPAGFAVLGPYTSQSHGEFDIQTSSLSPGIYALKIFPPGNSIPHVVKFLRR